MTDTITEAYEAWNRRSDTDTEACKLIRRLIDDLRIERQESPQSISEDLLDHVADTIEVIYRNPVPENAEYMAAEQVIPIAQWSLRKELQQAKARVAELEGLLRETVSPATRNWDDVVTEIKANLTSNPQPPQSLDFTVRDRTAMAEAVINPPEPTEEMIAMSRRHMPEEQLTGEEREKLIDAMGLAWHESATKGYGIPYSENTKAALSAIEQHYDLRRKPC